MAGLSFQSINLRKADGCRCVRFASGQGVCAQSPWIFLRAAYNGCLIHCKEKRRAVCVEFPFRLAWDRISRSGKNEALGRA